MTDFSWLNDIPTEEWQPQNCGFGRSFDIVWFIDKSQARGNDRWREDFDVWGVTQPRKYQQFDRPGSQTFITWGDWEGRG